MIITNKVWIRSVVRGTRLSIIPVVILSVASYILDKYLIGDTYMFPAIIPTVLGTALAFFLGFNNDQAYDRWWEARKIWGTLVNSSRTWCRQILSFVRPLDKESNSEIDEIKKQFIYRHLAFLNMLKANLRETTNDAQKGFLSEEEFHRISTSSNMHNSILDIQLEKLNKIYRNGNIDGFQFLELNKMITSFCEEMGKSERIKHTVFPTTYQRYAIMFIWFFVIAITLATENMAGPWSMLYGVIIGEVFLITHSIGMSLLNPFDNIISGISLDQITRTIEINLLETLGETDIPLPIESVGGNYIM